MDVNPPFNHLQTTVSKIKTEKGTKEMVLGMDHNLDLLKAHIHSKTQRFLDILIEHELLLTITRPSRTTQ